MKWSFSKLSTFDECPRAFWLTYLQDPPLPQQDNAWSDYGTLCHALLEEYAKGELKKEQLVSEFERRYPEAVVHPYPPFPKNYAEKAYAQAIDYFSNFNGFGDNYEIVSAEEYFEVPVGTYRFVGISDLVLRDKETGGLTVIDHKTKSPSSMKTDYPLYRNQLYLYALHVRQKYGRWPEKLSFNLIKDPKHSIWETFDIEQMNRTIAWATEQIDSILLEDTWAAFRADDIALGGSTFFCKFICPVVSFCEEAKEALSSRT